MFENTEEKQKFVNLENGEELIVNYRTFLSLVYGILTHYLRHDENTALNLIKKSGIYENPSDFYEALSVVHELEYHWAMLLSHGNLYWNNGFSSDEPDDYSQWVEKYTKQHNLERVIVE